MTYYNITGSVDLKVIGNTYPQSQKIQGNMDRRDPRHLVMVMGKFPDDVYIPDQLLHPKARVTDYISSAVVRQPIISDMLKEILMGYRQEGVEFVRTNLISRGREISYWIMNGYEMDYKNIDFSRSLVIKQQTGVILQRTEPVELDIRTAGGLEMAIESTQGVPYGISIEKMKLIDNIANDLFFIDKFSGRNYYISEKLKNIIKEAGCTGVGYFKVE